MLLLLPAPIWFAAMILVCFWPNGSASAQIPRQLGQGYHRATNSARSHCLVGGRHTIKQASASLQFSKRLTQTQLREALSGSFAGGANLFLVSGKITNTLASLSIKTSLHEKLVYRAQYTVGHDVLDAATASLSPTGKRFLATNEPELITEGCGDEYVAEVIHGGQIYIVADFTFASAEVKNQIETKITFKSLGFEKTKTFTTLSQDLKEATQVQFTALQVGGDPQKLHELLASLPQTSCRLNQLAKCFATIDGLLNYALAADGFVSQLRDSPWQVVSKPYATGGYRQLQPQASPILSQAARDAHDELATALATQKSLLGTAQEHLASDYLSPEPWEYLARQQLELLAQISQLKEDIARCRRQPATCQLALSSWQNNSEMVTAEDLAFTKDAYYYCQSQSAAMAKDLATLMAEIGSSDCEHFAQALPQASKLRLAGSGFSSWPLLSLATGLRELDLARNNLTSLYGLGTLPHLVALDISGNRISDLYPLRHQKQLRILKAQNNLVADAKALAALEHLEVLWLFLNPASTGADGFLGRQLKQKLFSHQEACDQRISELLAAGLIAAEEAAGYQASGFGPVVTAATEIYWLNCYVAAQGY